MYLFFHLIVFKAPSLFHLPSIFLYHFSLSLSNMFPAYLFQRYFFTVFLTEADYSKAAAFHVFMFYPNFFK